jgi:hypothetical protein
VGRIYYGSFKSYNGNTFLCEIWDGASGSTTSGTELKLSGDLLKIEQQGQGDKLYEKGTFTRKSKAVVSFVVNDSTTQGVFQNLGVDQEDKYALVVYRNGTLYWIGRILADQMQYERRALVNTPFEITAVDGLSLLDRFKIDPAWFNSTTLRINIVDLVRRMLATTGLDDYYDFLSASSNYIIDATEDQDLGTQEINLNSTIADFELFQDQSESIANSEIYKYCSEVLEDVLQGFGARIMYQLGRYWLFNPLHFAETNPISYKRYNTSGTYVSTIASYPHVDTLSTSARRQFESYPVITHQPALKHIRMNYKRRAFAWNVRTRSLSTTNVFSVGPLGPPSSVNFQDPSLQVKAILKFAQQSFTVPPKVAKINILYRVFGWDSSMGWKGWDDAQQAWVSVATQPGFIQVQADVINYELAPNRTVAIYTLDFEKTFTAFIPSDYDFFAEFQIAGSNISNPISNPTTSGIDIWGSAFLNVEDLEKKTTRVANTNNTGASEIYETEIKYGYPEIWISPQITGRGGDSVNRYASKMMALYCKSPMTIEGNYIDSGGYNAMRVLSFDSYFWLFNGGVFLAQKEQWNANWVRVLPSPDNVVINAEDIIDVVDTTDKTADAVRRIISQVQGVRDNLSNLPVNMPYDIMGVALQAPTSTPTINTDFAILASYVQGSNQLYFKVQELGKVKTITAGTHTQNTNEELIICNTAEGAITVNLGDATLLKGKTYSFKKTHQNHAMIIQATLIDDNGVVSLNSKNACLTVQSDGVQWWVISVYP